MGKLYKQGSYRIGELQIDNVAFAGVTAGVYSNLADSLDKKVARVGVFGNAFDEYTPRDVGLDFDAVASQALLIGKLIAREGLIFVNGACPGIPNIAAQGAKAHNGIVTGFSPLKDESLHFSTYHWDKCEVPHTIIAYLGKLKRSKESSSELDRLFLTRDLVNIFSSDAIIVIGGSYGTNHEVAAAAELGLPIMLLKGTGGVADKAKAYYESIAKPNNSAVFIEERDPRLLAERMLNELFSRGTITRETKRGRDPLDTVLRRIEMQQAA